jgi:hypothetical protein
MKEVSGPQIEVPDSHPLQKQGTVRQMLRLQRKSLGQRRLDDTFKMDPKAVSKIMKEIKGKKPHKQLAMILLAAKEEKAKCSSPHQKSATIKQVKYKKN